MIISLYGAHKHVLYPCDAPQRHTIYVEISGFGWDLIIYQKNNFSSIFFMAQIDGPKC